jgi:hypothetical protein
MKSDNRLVVLSDGLDQLPPSEVLFTVKKPTVNVVDVCKRT